MRIYGIHPADKDLKVFRKLNKSLSDKYRNNFLYLRLDRDYHSHDFCIETLKKSNMALLLFFCHAFPRRIRGCNYENAAGNLVHKDFRYGDFITPQMNIEIFRGKKVFCLACNSDSLGSHAIRAGASVFLGFKEVPFYMRENFKEEKITMFVKTRLRIILYESLCRAIDENYSFNEFSVFLRHKFNQHRFELMKDKRYGRTTRLEVARVLSVIKNGITMFGDGNTRFCD